MYPFGSISSFPLSAAVAGVCVGLGGYTFWYAQGASYLSAIAGYRSDIIDLTGGNRPGPIAEIINNTFVSAVDEISRALGKPVFPVHASSPQIEAVAMDMSQAYASTVARHLPNALIVFDRFHVMKLMNEKLDDLAREHRLDVDLDRRLDGAPDLSHPITQPLELHNA